MDQGTPVSLKTQSDEWDDVDTMNVFPTNRWDITNDGFTASIEDAVLNISDTGDGTADKYWLERDLRDSSGTVEVRFHLKGGGGHLEDYFDIRLEQTDDGYSYMRFLVNYMNGGVETTAIAFRNEDGYHSKTLTGSERVYSESWYVLKIDYDILQSNYRWRLYFDENGSKVFDYVWQDISASEIPNFFEDQKQEIRILSFCRSNNDYLEVLLDYVNAPFATQKWEHTTEGSDAQWLEHDAWDHVYFEDDIATESQIWDLTVPYLDSVSGVLRIELLDWTALINNDQISMGFYIYAIDADDGGAHEAMEVSLYFRRSGANHQFQYEFELDGTAVYDSGWTTYSTGALYLSFAAGLFDERQYLSARAHVGWDETDETATNEFFGDVAISDVATDPSHEFVLRINYGIVGFLGDTEADMWIESFDYSSNDWFKELADLITKGPIGYFTSKVAEGFDQAILSLVSPFLDSLVKFIGGAFDAVITPLYELLDEWTGGFLTDMVSIWDDLWSELSNWIDDVIDDAITHSLTVVSDIIDLIMNIIFDGWDDISGGGILAVINKVWTQFNSAVNDATSGLDDIKSYIDFWTNFLVIMLTVIALGVPMLMYMHTRNFGTYVSEFIRVQTTDVLPVSIFGWSVYIPFGLVWFPLFLFELGWSG